VVKPPRLAAYCKLSSPFSLGRMQLEAAIAALMGNRGLLSI